MTTKFLVNDTVRYVRGPYSGPLTVGSLYKVRKVSPRGSVIHLEGVCGSFTAARFELFRRTDVALAEGQLVRFRADANAQSYAVSRGIPTDRDLRISSIWDGGGIVGLGPHGVHPASYLIPAPKEEAKEEPKKLPLSVKVPTDDVMALLSQYVKDTFGIDAKVDKVIEAFGDALELEFAK